jgi:hypothetical protein
VVFGGSVALGCLLGYMLGGRRYYYRWVPPSPPTRAEGKTNGAAGLSAAALSAEPQPPPRAGESKPSTFSWLGEQLSHLKGLAVSSLMGVIRDLATRQLPEALSHRLAEELDQMTRRMGGEPIQGSVLPEQKSGSQETRREGDGRGQEGTGAPAREAGQESHGSTGPRW